MSNAHEEVLEKIEKMSVIELSELVKAIETKFGVSAAAPMMAMGATAGAAASPIAEEQTEFSAILKDAGSQKIQVIKVIRELTSLGLKESKALVDTAPKPVKEGVDKATAEDIKKKLEEVGAIVEIK
jgi:large subunit ribosomal protein L7/L12